MSQVTPPTFASKIRSLLTFRNSKTVYSAALRVGIGVAIAFLICQFSFDYIEALFYDARVRLTPTPATSGNIELIGIRSNTIQSLGRVPNAVDHLRLLQRIEVATPRVVIYLISPNEIVGSFDDLKILADEMHKIQASQRDGKGFYVAFQDTPLKGDADGFRLYPPFEGLNIGSAPKTSDRGIFAGDSVSRRAFLSYQGLPALHPIVASLYNSEISDENNVRGRFEYLQSSQVYIQFHPTGTYPIWDFENVTTGAIDAARFRDKIVIIGRDIQTTAQDYVKTPLSRDVVAQTYLELNANIFDTLIRNSAPLKPPLTIDALITGLISILTVYVVLAMKPTRGLVVLGAALASFFLFCFLCFWAADLWIGMAHPFLTVFVAYYFFIPYRLIIENRRSWEYYQKNRLLTQVEELKTNFLSMMSHDLKTPIARIQGMTDVVMQDENPLSPRQKEAIKTLARSSDELLAFVSSILDLGRIESKELKLHLQSKDPNSLVLEVIKKYDYMALAKKIEITAELETLFSVKMDVDLIRQVLSNLIENAIKYSPENSRILVTTEEQNGEVVIQVADQGAGIPEDELPHVFMKFYRSKDAKSSKIKGSGLGLYLAKYFIELHKGQIVVDSRPGEGSTFTVRLPLQP